MDVILSVPFCERARVAPEVGGKDALGYGGRLPQSFQLRDLGADQAPACPFGAGCARHRGGPPPRPAQLMVSACLSQISGKLQATPFQPQALGLLRVPLARPFWKGRGTLSMCPSKRSSVSPVHSTSTVFGPELVSFLAGRALTLACPGSSPMS